jgi:drug/metabolite transporter (DMT)-like permease
VVGVALAAWLLAEALAPIQVVGALAVLGAAVLLQRSASGAGSTADEADGARPVIVPGGP